MKKIGILTFWNVPNYGAFMQAYAMQKVLCLRYEDYEVYQIPYLNEMHYSQYDSMLDKNILTNFLSYYNVIPHEEIDIVKQKMDCLVLGSDIIWDYSVEFFGQDKYLFGEGINAVKKISYAPSFGTVAVGAKPPEYVVRGLKNLDAISVRDDKSKKIVKEISGKDATVVLDPTLIWDFASDENIVKPEIDQDYIIVYGSFFTDELIKGAIEYCKNHRLKLICLSSLDDTYDWCDVTIDQDQLNPFEWGGYFKYANAVMTCTYHGLLFGLIFKKKIIFNPTKFIMHKADTFIETLNLKHILIEELSFNNKMNWGWDYSQIDTKIEDFRKMSFAFLDENLKQKVDIL